MLLTFFKYQGTGNDFIIIDNRKEWFDKENTVFIASLCDRRFGIGADGLILLENDDFNDFKMDYYNSDGRQGTMCGNGGRCLVAFAKHLGIIDKEASFIAVDGNHYATIDNDIVSLQMQDVSVLTKKEKYTFLDIGSPHHIQLVKNIEDFNVAKEGAKLRYGIYGKKGSNINFVKQIGVDMFSVRTYERGVENETLSCGTGVTAVALAMHNRGLTDNDKISIKTLGGELLVKFEVESKRYKNIYLIGQVKPVFKGEIIC